MVTKKSECWKATIQMSSDEHAALAASLVGEDAICSVNGDVISVEIMGASASDLRAMFNSTMRSLRAASEALSSIS